MNRERALRYRLDFLRLKLEVARENGYDCMQGRIEHEIDRVQHELGEGRDFEPPPSNAE